MPLPVRRYNDGIQIITGHQFFKAVIILVISVRFRVPSINDHLFSAGQVLLINIAKRWKGNVFHLKQV